MNLRAFPFIQVGSMLRDYLDLTETQLKTAFEHRKESLRREQQQSCDEPPEYWKMEEDELELQWGQLRQTHRRSVVVMTHVVLETTLDKLCRQLQEERRSTIALADLRSSGIARAQLFLDKALAITVNGKPIGASPVYARLREYQKVRDCIVHANGVLGALKADTDRNTIMGLARRGVGIEISYFGDGEEIDVRPEFCRKYIHEVDSLFAELLKALGWS